MKRKISYLLSCLFFLASPLAVFAVDSKLLNPLGTAEPEVLIGTIIKAILGLSGSVALLVFVYGGFMYLISAGDTKRVEKGKETLKNAALGLVIIFASYLIVTAIIFALTKGDALNKTATPTPCQQQTPSDPNAPISPC